MSKYFGSGQKRRRVPVFFLPTRADDVERGRAIAVLEAHAVLVAFALDEDIDMLRQRVDHAHADAVQAAGEGVVLVAELAACVQAREDQFDAGDLFVRVDVHRHAAAVVGDFAAAVVVERHLDRARVAGEGLVDGVVDDFLRQVVRARGVRVHARTALDRVQAGEDFDVGGVVARAHAAIAMREVAMREVGVLRISELLRAANAALKQIRAATGTTSG